MPSPPHSPHAHPPAAGGPPVRPPGRAGRAPRRADLATGPHRPGVHRVRRRAAGRTRCPGAQRRGALPGQRRRVLRREWRGQFRGERHRCRRADAGAATGAARRARPGGVHQFRCRPEGFGERMASSSASKFALRAFADSLRTDEPSLRVTSIFPGRTDSEMQRDLVAYQGGTYDPAKFLRPETVGRLVCAGGEHPARRLRPRDRSPRPRQLGRDHPVRIQHELLGHPESKAA